MYNALNGSGDELYGVEPPSYYIKNLLLMLGVVAFPLALLSPIALLFRNEISQPLSDPHKVLTICVACFVWLILLVSRPHKVCLYKQVY